MLLELCLQNAHLFSRTPLDTPLVLPLLQGNPLIGFWWTKKKQWSAHLQNCFKTKSWLGPGSLHQTPSESLSLVARHQITLPTMKFFLVHCWVWWGTEKDSNGFYYFPIIVFQLLLIIGVYPREIHFPKNVMCFRKIMNFFCRFPRPILYYPLISHLL